MMIRVNKYWVWGAIAAASFLDATVTMAQVVPDQTTPTTIQGACDAVCTVTGGTQVGPNVFHSFEDFSIPVRGTAFFNIRTLRVENIFARVTGDTPSVVRGTLRANHQANMFLINPNGIVFGPNARLDIGGSFVATTADAIQFSDRGIFSARNPEPPSPLLSVAPSAFLFQQTHPQPITYRGQDNFVGLEVPNGRSLLLLGGDVHVESALLRANSGRIVLGGVAEAGSVGLDRQGREFSLNFPDTLAGSTVQLSNTRLNVASPLFDASSPSGSVSLYGRSVSLVANSEIRASNFGDEPAGAIAIQAQDDILFAGTSRIFAETLGRGRAGDINLQAGRAVTLDNGTLQASSRRSPLGVPDIGSGGNIQVSTGSLTLTHNSTLAAQTESSGNAGNILLQADRVSIINSKVDNSALSTDSGNAGTITIAANTLTLDQLGRIVAATFSAAGGTVQLNVQEYVLLRHGSTISAGAFDDQSGGDVDINTGFVIAIDTENSDILANAVAGAGGNISITARGIFGLVPRTTTTTFSDITAASRFGQDGTVTITTPDVDPSRGTAVLPSQVVDASQLIAGGCQAGHTLAAERGEFLITGRGGVAATPTDATEGLTWDDLRPIASHQRDRPVPVAPVSSGSSPVMVEAQGWVVNSEGGVSLLAQAPAIASNSAGASLSCLNRPDRHEILDTAH